MLALPVIDKPREECGVIGIHTPGDLSAARKVYWGLSALQHRGQEAAGIAAWCDDRVELRRGVGLVGSVFHEEHLQALPTSMAVGHVRYSTTGGSHLENAGPMPAGERIVVSHNGNLVDARRLREELVADGYEFASTSDSEIIAARILRAETDGWSAMRRFVSEVRGAFSLCTIVDGALYAARDPHGIRPLVLGLLESDGPPSYVVASETCALDLLGARYLRDIVPGEVVEISERGLRSEQVMPPHHRGCSFEAIYFSRPDSKLGNEAVYNIRLRLGQELARDYPVDADLVVGVPDSGTPMAIGYSDKSGIAFGEAIIRNRYIARTFIEPTQAEREMAIRKKLNPIAQSITGRRLVIVDDSLIRGNTLKTVVELLRNAGAQEVHLRIGSPPARHPCFYGVDMGRPGEYIAEGRTVDEIATTLGADSLHYLSLPGLARALRRPLNRRCTACFTGDYPIPPSLDEGRMAKDQFERGTIGG